MSSDVIRSDGYNDMLVADHGNPPHDFAEQLKAKFNLTDEDLKTHAVVLSQDNPYDMDRAQVVKLPPDFQMNILLSGVAELAKKHRLTKDRQNSIGLLAVQEFNAGGTLDSATERIRLAVSRMVPNTSTIKRKQVDKIMVVGKTSKKKRKALAKALKNRTVKFKKK
jgi:hypothetical protein